MPHTDPNPNCCASGVRIALCLLLAALFPPVVHAAGPRWVSGPPYFTSSPVPIGWGTLAPLYFTDPGDLSPYVNHAAADAIVAAAANVWNIPTAAITLAQGGTLAEHVSSANAYLSSSGPVFPADVQASNDAAIQIAVLYDSDGSITDMLLGSGASAPFECRQNAVTESVDAVSPAAQIQHAILVLNGRCTGSAPQQQLQLQYQIERAFGRILGLGWSQTNDNVFTGTPQPTPAQTQHWPILHPIDILCGPYSYQCLPSPFTLRDDDVASISGLYPMYAQEPFPTPTPAPGKVWSYIQAGYVYGSLSFPTGQGMQGVNIELQRIRGGVPTPEGFADVSTVTGANYRGNNGNPVLGIPGADWSSSLGVLDPAQEGSYLIPWVPCIDPIGTFNGSMHGILTTEPVNPLYVGTYSVGPYRLGNVEPSGPSQSVATPNPIYPNTVSWTPVYQPIPNTGASSCSTTDGTESSPAAIDPSGWWTGLLCAYGHTAWSSFPMQAARTATIEVTALDESGLATTAKAMPLIGAWAAADPTGTLPTVAATPSAFNTIALGTTATQLATSTASQPIRFVIADARGDGRPDFAYRARVLYADQIQPTAISTAGGLVTITGTGFRLGNIVTVNGVAASVASWTSTSIAFLAPPQSAFAPAPTGPVDITVSDRSTGGSTTMSAVLTYSSSIAPDILTLITAPPATVLVGQAAAFVVRVLLGDGVTPVPGMPVVFALSGPAQIAGCPGSPCTLLTDAAGLASASVTPSSFGAVALSASAVGATITASFNAVARSLTPIQSTEYIAADATVSWTPQLAAIQNSAPAANLTVSWTGSAGFSVSPAATTTNAQGLTQTAATLGPLTSAAQSTAQACAWQSSPPSLCATFTAIAVAPSALRIAVVSGANQVITAPAAFAPVTLRVTDTTGHPVAGAAVNLYQTIAAYEMPCPATGPCPIPPVLASANSASVSDTSGLLTVTPIQLSGNSGGVTNLAAATGTQGFTALSLTQQP